MNWEYHLLSAGLDREDHVIQDSLNKRGQDGWELVAVYQAAFRVFVLKRPLSSPESK